MQQEHKAGTVRGSRTGLLRQGGHKARSQGPDGTVWRQPCSGSAVGPGGLAQLSGTLVSHDYTEADDIHLIRGCVTRQTCCRPVHQFENPSSFYFLRKLMGSISTSQFVVFLSNNLYCFPDKRFSRKPWHVFKSVNWNASDISQTKQISLAKDRREKTRCGHSASQPPGRGQPRPKPHGREEPAEPGWPSAGVCEGAVWLYDGWLWARSPQRASVYSFVEHTRPWP